MKRNGKIRWKCSNGWSDWYFFGNLPAELQRREDITSVEVVEEMTKAEYEAMIKEYNNVSTQK